MSVTIPRDATAHPDYQAALAAVAGSREAKARGDVRAERLLLGEGEATHRLHPGRQSPATTPVSAYLHAWAVNPPQPGDADYQAYVLAQPAERARLRRLAESVVGPGPLVEVLRTPAAADERDFEPVSRTVEEQVAAFAVIPQEPAHTVLASGEDLVLPPPSDPMAVARALVELRYLEPGALTLRNWRGGWWSWARSHWIEHEERAIRKECYAFTEHALYEKPDPKGGPPTLAKWEPTRFKIGNLLEATAAITHLDETVDQPTWIEDRDGVAVVAVANGLLDLERRRLLPHSPYYFNQTAVPFDYEPDALPPARWLAFLAELWPDDPDSTAALAEFFGYVISGRLDLHKILLVVGPTRGGKGTIARILGKLIGPRNVAGPTLSSLSFDFGLAPLLGKSLAVISDARLDASRDSSVVVERLLAISGEDTITVNRKYREQWTGKLPTRFLVVSNELPRLGDASATIANRFVVLLLRESWLGREDHTLEPTLTAELSGILNWALEGLDRLAEQDRFTRPTSTDEAILALQDLASPVAAFVRDECHTGPTSEVMIDTIYGRWKEWAETNGNRAGSRQTFGRNLRAVVPGLRVTQPREGETRDRLYRGIGLVPVPPTVQRSAFHRVPEHADDATETAGTRWHAIQPDVGGTHRSTVDTPDGDGPRPEPSSAVVTGAPTCPTCGKTMITIDGSPPVCTNGPGHRKPINGAATPDDSSGTLPVWDPESATDDGAEGLPA